MHGFDRSSGLPSQATQLVGRVQEIAAIRELLLRPDVRLVTIAGTAGIGKTRLAIAAAEDLQTSFANAALFVDLSTVAEPSGVLVAIGRCLGLLEVTSAAALKRVCEVVSDRSLLLILDNFEQVLPAATDLARMLGATDRVKLLVTSRAPLRITWEHVVQTPPLDLPDLIDLPCVEQLARIPSVALLLERAEAAGSDLRLRPDNARAVAELCVRLEGVPLALELAATQTRFTAPEGQLARMEHRLDLLADGARDHPPRQRTLREAIGWSYKLLTEANQAVFRRLGVFVGGISLDAAGAIVGEGTETDVLQSLAALAEQNLLRCETLSNGESYYWMLETIREYARERLAEAGGLALAQYQYAAYWRDLVEAAENELRGPSQVQWFDRLERERPNLIGALTWAERANQIELGVRLAAALGWFWYVRGGDRSEGRRWLVRFAGQAASVPSATTARARALSAAGLLAQYQRDLPTAQALQEAALALGREIESPSIVALALGRLAHLYLFRAQFEHGDELANASYALCHQHADRWGMAFALGTRGLIARSSGRVEDATRFLRESANLFREQGDRWGVAHVMLGLGQLALYGGDLDEAEECWEERLRLSREIDNQTGVGHTLDLLATLKRQRGEYGPASVLFEQALAIKRRIGDRQAIAWTLQAIGELAMARGEMSVAYAHFRDSLRLRREIDEPPELVASLIAFARLAAVLRRHRRAVRLASAAHALQATIGPTLAVQPYGLRVRSTEISPVHPELERAQRRLSDAQRQAAWDEGAAMPLEEAIADALGLEAELRTQADSTHPEGSARSASAPPVAVPRWPGGAEPLSTDLTRREREVAALLARGYSNRQIAATLVITEGSAHVQVARLLSKLGVHSRAQAAVWATRQQL